MSLRFERYSCGGCEEWMAVRGPVDGPRVMIVPPLFEEMNFTRATLTAFAGDLAERGIATWLIDLPGTGESARPLEAVTWVEWRDAVAAAALTIGRPHVAAIRGGALLDDTAAVASRWRFAATPGASLIRQMERAQAIGDREGRRPPADPSAPSRDLIGYQMPHAFVESVRSAVPANPHGSIRTVPFPLPDSASGIAPWRRAEPAADVALAAALAADLAEWIDRCGG